MFPPKIVQDNSYSVFQTDGRQAPAPRQPSRMAFPAATGKGIAAAALTVCIVMMTIPDHAAASEAMAHATAHATGILFVAMAAVFAGMVAMVGRSWSKARASVRQGEGSRSHRIG